MNMGPSRFPRVWYCRSVWPYKRGNIQADFPWANGVQWLQHFTPAKPHWCVQTASASDWWVNTTKGIQITMVSTRKSANTNTAEAGISECLTWFLIKMHHLEQDRQFGTVLLGEVLKVGIQNTQVFSVHSNMQLWNAFRSRPRFLNRVNIPDWTGRHSITTQQLTDNVILVKIDIILLWANLSKNYGATKYMCLFWQK